jgi:hypothetical protein
VQDAAYLRSQAELCLQVARETSDNRIANNLRAAAARYFARACDVERPPQLNSPHIQHQEAEDGPLFLPGQVSG